MNDRLSTSTVLMLAAWTVRCPLVVQAADTPAKYKQPVLPKEELALRAFYPFSEVHVLAIDGLEYAASTFLPRGYNALNVYAALQQRAEAHAQLTQLDMAIADNTRALALTPGQSQWVQRLEELKRDKGGALVLNQGKRAGMAVYHSGSQPA